MEKNSVVRSAVTGKRYRICNQIGVGGFGEVMRASELDDKRRKQREVCIKITTDASSWHRESYFGELLRRSRRVIQLLDSFPLPPKPRSRKPMRYCLVLELARHGTIADYLEATQRAWPERRAVREIRALLKVLDQLHAGSATHRDLTPSNVFVCGSGILKLGDFGIARHALAGKPGAVEGFNPAFVTRGFVYENHLHWTAADDVFQMGQLLAMLLRGEASGIISAGQARGLDCGPRLKAVIRKSIGPRHKRYADAYEMLEALEGRPAPEPRLKSLAGKTVLFTGPLSMRRFDARLHVVQQGGRVVDAMSRKVQVLIQGARSRRYKHGHKGTTLKRAEALVKKGVRITIIGEAEFRRLIRLPRGA